jgi:hypothetical protein
MPLALFAACQGEVFALRAKDITPFHSKETKQATLPSAMEKFNQNWPKTALAGWFGPV